MKPIRIIAVVAPCLLATAPPALAETVNCTNITALPATITVPGVYCLKQDLATSMTSGAAITINANSVTIDFNGYKLGGLGGGPATTASGVYADNRKNVTLRNGNIRGFFYGIFLPDSNSGASSGHLIENNLVDSSTYSGISVRGSGIIVRNNRVLNTTVTSTIGAFGLLGINLRNSLFTDNVIAGTSNATYEAYGINVQGASTNVEISRNTVLDIRGNNFAGGIWIASAGNVVAENVVIGVTAATATANGIWNTSSGSLICRDNTVSRVTTNATVGCTAESGTFPPPGP
jgi:parallel beta-helix repeat protein